MKIRIDTVLPTERLVAVRPPEYWPRPHVVALIDAADIAVMGDTFQYSRQSFQNRTPVRTPNGRQWLSVPLAGGQHGRPIVDVAIHGRRRWLRKHWRALHFNYRTAPFFEFYEPVLAPLFEMEWTRLGDLTCASARVLIEILGIPTPLLTASDMPGQPATPGQVVEAADGGTMLSAPDTAGADSRLTDMGAVLQFEPITYRQNFDGFEPGMSTLDILFNYGPETLPIIRRAARLELFNAVGFGRAQG